MKFTAKQIRAFKRRREKTEKHFNKSQKQGMSVSVYGDIYHLNRQEFSDLLDRTHYCLVGAREGYNEQ